MPGDQQKWSSLRVLATAKLGAPNGQCKKTATLASGDFRCRSRGVRKIGYDVSRMTFEFTMVDNKAKVVSCEISSAAMDELAGVRGTMPADREAQFLHLRDRIDRIVSETF